MQAPPASERALPWVTAALILGLLLNKLKQAEGAEGAGAMSSVLSPRCTDHVLLRQTVLIPAWLELSLGRHCLPLLCDGD